VLNNFNDLKKSDFFRCQEFLHGQSICDICLSDPNSIKSALTMDNSKIGSIDGSIIKNISKGDKVRRDAFQQIKFYNENLIIAQDLNYISTFERGLYQNAVLSVKIILRHIF
jgi:hypothetical protein